MKQGTLTRNSENKLKRSATIDPKFEIVSANMASSLQTEAPSAQFKPMVGTKNQTEDVNPHSTRVENSPMGKKKENKRRIALAKLEKL